MADINHVVLVGRLTRDAELKYTNTGTAICKFSIANNQRRKRDDQWVDEAHFFDVTLWGKAAEAVSQYLVKGKQVGVEGQLRQSRWEQDGQPRIRVEINAANLQLLGSPGGASQQQQQSAPDSGYPGGQQEPYPKDEFEDDIPF